MADALEGEAQEFTIIKKKIKLPAEAHGGAWKVAYADFVTAMMAFFLLLWLLNASTEDQMTGLSDYFAPESVADDAQGVGDVLAGLSVAADGALRSATSRPSVSISIPTFGEEEKGEETGEERDDPDATSVNLGDAAEEEAELELLDEAMTKLRQSITQNPELQELMSSLQIEQTPEGLRIQLLDQDKNSMFKDNGAELASRARRLLALVGTIIVRLPNSITITGHTNGVDGGSSQSYGKWELSSDRAANTRRWLVEAGLPTERIVTVSGVADTIPLNVKDPDAVKNGRVSILITRKFPGRPEVEEAEDDEEDSGGFGDDDAGGFEFGGDGPPPLPDE